MQVICSVVVQERVAVLLLLDGFDAQSLAGEAGGHRAALTQMFPSCRGEVGAPPAAVPSQVRADLRRAETLHLTSGPRLVQLHGGFLIPGGNRSLVTQT